MSLNGKYGIFPGGVMYAEEKKDKLLVEKVDQRNKDLYVDYINSREDTSFVDCWEWRQVVEHTYNLPHYWYMARRGSRIFGVLCLTLTDHPFFGKYMTTAPFGTQGGFYADSEESFHALRAQAEKLNRDLGVKYTLIRHLSGETPPPAGWHQDPSYATYHLPLEADLETFLKNHLTTHRRSQVRRSFLQGHRMAFGRIDLLEDFWEVINRSMKEMGSPYHSKKYLAVLLKVFGDKAEVGILYNKDRPIGCCLFICHNKILNLVHAVFLKEYRHMFTGEYLYCSLIDEGCRRGIKVIDMGRSLVNSGNESFKMHWHPKRIPLGYWYKIPDGVAPPNLNQNNPKYQLAIKAWKRLPMPLVRLVGPRLIYGIL